MRDHYRLLGGPGSPYSMKMRALLRYRRIPHVWTVPRGFFITGPELAKAGKRMIPVLQYPDGTYWADSTPLAFDLEKRHPNGRSIIPDDPALGFLAHLLEDMADEFLVLAMFDYRWALPRDQAFCARRQISGWMSPMPSDQFEQVAETFRLRQSGMLQLASPGEGNRTLLQSFYHRALAILEGGQERSLFLFGSRPSLADFGWFGQLSQCAIDPTASEIMRSEAPRTFQWVQLLDDSSGIEGEWSGWDGLQTVRELLQLAATTYLPFMLAYAEAAQAGRGSVEVEIEGLQWRGIVQPYKAKCLAWLRQALVEIEGESRPQLEALLRTTGCWDFLQFPPGAPRAIEPMLPV